MSKVMVTSHIAALAAMLLVAPVLVSAQPVSAPPVSAQTQQPSREDNIWGGRAHQPTQADVNQQEKAAGIAPPQQSEQRATVEVESLYQSLIQGSGKRSP
jgi:hypothetical protein